MPGMNLTEEEHEELKKIADYYGAVMVVRRPDEGGIAAVMVGRTMGLEHCAAFLATLSKGIGGIVGNHVARHGPDPMEELSRELETVAEKIREFVGLGDGRVYGTIRKVTDDPPGKEWAEKQPQDGDLILNCGHSTKKKGWHWFHQDPPKEFEAPDGTKGKSNWMAICGPCFHASGGNASKVDVMSHWTWKGDDPHIPAFGEQFKPKPKKR